MSAAELEDCFMESEQATQLAVSAAVLEERINNHIKLFWRVVVGGGLWLAAISSALYRINGTMNRVEIAQANAPAQIVAGLLKQPPLLESEAAEKLNAASTLLRETKIKAVRPDPAILKEVSSEISRDQQKYPDLPAVWRATSAFINYRSDALLPEPAEQALASARLFDCRGGSIRLYQGRAFVEKCTLDLERGVAGDNVTFVNCIIQYRGGPIPIKRMEFINCVFRFEVTNVPFKEGAIAMMQLTTSADRDIRIALPS
jgi:hypothetical protein